jgi:excisionase family DNA binding protein
MRARSNLPPRGNEPLPPAREWFTTGQVAARLGVCATQVSRWIDSGRLAGIRIPGSRDRRVHIAAIRAFEIQYGYDRARRNG